MGVKAIPDGYHSITPGMNIKNCEAAIEFYKKVFGAEEKARFVGQSGKIVHCELKVGDSLIMLSEAVQQPVHHVYAMIYVQDCDVVFKKAVDAGATVKTPLQNMFYGDRAGTVVDPFGNNWFIATHKEDVSQEELQRRMKSGMPAAP